MQYLHAPANTKRWFNCYDRRRDPEGHDDIIEISFAYFKDIRFYAALFNSDGNDSCAAENVQNKADIVADQYLHTNYARYAAYASDYCCILFNTNAETK